MSDGKPRGDEEELLYFNGVNGSTGDYGLPPMEAESLAGFIQGEPDELFFKELQWRHRQKGRRHHGAKEGVDLKKLEETGWGVIFPEDADPALREALAPLLELRREQAGDHFAVYSADDGVKHRETKAKFLARHGAGPGPVDPGKVPYYLLLVGSPEDVTYRFQSQLDVQYGVGRIHFDTVEEYASYAASVVAAEKKETSRPRQVSLFGVANDDDRATSMSVRRLVVPLSEHFRDKWPDCPVETIVRGEATKASLARLLGGEATPALLFSATHGMEFHNGDPRQLSHQGALLCQDWPGPRAWRGSLPQDFYFAADDLGDRADLSGLVAFFFACYGAGTPKHDEFAKQFGKAHREARAPHAFLGALPKRMLGHPRGGALAVVGHVERSWGYSFLWRGAGSQTAVFESALDRLLEGYPVGAAVEFFNERYAELSTMLADQLEELDHGGEVDSQELVATWTANNDARGYVVLGDPAVRLAVRESSVNQKEM